MDSVLYGNMCVRLCVLVGLQHADACGGYYKKGAYNVIFCLLNLCILMRYHHPFICIYIFGVKLNDVVIIAYHFFISEYSISICTMNIMQVIQLCLAVRNNLLKKQ